MLELHTFGGLALRTGDGERIEALAGRTKCLALLAYLAVEPPDGRVPRVEVASLLWSGRTDDRARNSLRVALSQIRQATDSPLLAGNGASDLGLVRDRMWADVVAFREAVEAGEEARALELYGGDFLAGVRVQGARPFRRWADRKRGHLRQQAYEAAVSVGTSARQAGDLASAEDAFRRALDLGPLREEAARELIETLAERGRSADAVQLYEAFRQRREAELEMAPSEELRKRVKELKQAPPAVSAGVGGRETVSAAEFAPAETGGSSADDPEGSPPRHATAPMGHKPSRWGRFRRRTLLGGVVAVVLLAAALAAAWHVLRAGDGAAAAPAGDRSVAVLPFEATGTEDPGPIAAGLHSDLLTRLSNVGDLDVISATSVERFRDADVPLPAIADSLGVNWVLEGHVQRAGDGIEVNAQLIDPRTDTHAWAETYRRELTAENLFDLQRDITRRITGVLETRLTAGEEDRLDRRTTESLEAHRFYVRGRSLLEQRKVPEMRRALDYFEQALARDSSYALAWAGRADALSVLSRRPEPNQDTLLPAAAEAVERALALEPNLAEAFTARGRLHMYGHEGPAALRTFKHAIETKPSYAAAHAWLSKLQLSIDRPEEALISARRSVELDPLSIENQGTLCHALIANDQPKEALRVARHIADLRPESASLPACEITVQMEMGHVDELERIADKIGRSDAEPPWLAQVRAATGGDTVPVAKMLEELDGIERAVTRITLHAALGHHDRAFELMHQTYPRKDWPYPWDFSFAVQLRHFFGPILDPLRDDPRWDRFMGVMNTHWGLNPDGSLPEETGG